MKLAVTKILSIPIPESRVGWISQFTNARYLHYSLILCRAAQLSSVLPENTYTSSYPMPVQDSVRTPKLNILALQSQKSGE